MAEPTTLPALDAYRRDGRLALLAAAAVAVFVAFMTIGLRGNIAFVLELRATQLLVFAQVGIAIAVSTVLFQTISGNHILTPSIMGLDALYLFCQTALVFALGGLGFATLDAQVKFAGEVILMMALALALFLPLLRQRVDMTLMLLTGVVLGLMFRSLSSLIARLIDPNDFAVLQGASFASFTTAPAELLAIGGVVTVAGVAVAWRARNVLDILALGPDAATGLGVAWRPTVTALLLLVAALVAVSTALVGPIAFLGLLVVALAERVMGTRRHAVLLPAASLIAVLVLVGGQVLLQHGLGGQSVLSVIVEFVGGLVFLMLLFGRRRA
ncbi:iron chelate uptake ABC transporter family permease subunit [Mesorhizobium sp. CAU 1732]|uniref:iron chelate uptake ABC transporter family permease subunit n=1 Tax=Mesorhizobium sp. CAU 1732 TaxID=3140358 RepID=UPI003261B2C5